MIKIWYLLKIWNHRVFPHSHRIYFFVFEFCDSLVFLLLAILTTFYQLYGQQIEKLSWAALLFFSGMLTLADGKLSCVLFYYTFTSPWLWTVRFSFFPDLGSELSFLLLMPELCLNSDDTVLKPFLPIYLPPLFFQWKQRELFVSILWIWQTFKGSSSVFHWFVFFFRLHSV